MDTSKILTADLLDLVFDDRNKSYGAYELRKSYNKRISRALIITGCLITAVIGTTVLANSKTDYDNEREKYTAVVLEDLPEEKPIEIKKPEVKKTEPIQTKTEIYVAPQIVPDEEYDKPMASQDDLINAQIDIKKTEGDPFTGIATPGDIDGERDIIVEKKEPEPDIWVNIQVEAKFPGNWERFLTRNLNAEVAVENNAPPGRYTAIIQFVVDREGQVSDIKPLTSHGYGIEEEAVRVLRKADKWEPGIQNGYKVKSYKRQSITFVIE